MIVSILGDLRTPRAHRQLARPFFLKWPRSGASAPQAEGGTRPTHPACRDVEVSMRGVTTIRPQWLNLGLIAMSPNDRGAVPRPAVPGGCRLAPARRGGRRRGRS